jgi:hypothetical protein
MQHRHINTTDWTREAIDSALERGALEDWRELFQAAKDNRALAQDILAMASFHNEDGTSALVEGLLKKTHPELFTSEMVW